jgi:RNA polymerase sigma-70 factor (ECF subfamily)
VPHLVQITAPPELIALACSGNEHARAQLYETLAPATFGLIRRMSGSKALAEDLFQDTMITFFERLNTYRAEAPLGAWLRQIAISKCLMYLRSPWHRARAEVERLDLDIRTTHDPAPESLDVERALTTLSPTARAVVWLYEVEGYTHEEIAQSFGRTASFSKSQLARAHRRLRAWFEPHAGRQTCTPT